jgi:hypothetical protein
MKSWNRRGLTRGFGDEETEEEDGDVLTAEPTDSGSEIAEPDYSFDGYTVEFIDKVAFMPVTSASPVTISQSRRR